MIYMGDTGVIISYTVTNQTITGATGAVLKYTKPDGTTGEWDATIDGNSLAYETLSTDLDMVGKWAIQPYLTLDGWTGHAEMTSFIVYEHI